MLTNMGILRRTLRALGVGAPTVQEQYDLAMTTLSRGETASARVMAMQLRARATSPTDRALLTELESWCLLCEGRPAEARDLAANAATSSMLVLAVLGVVLGTSEGAVDALGEALSKMPALDLVAAALVACNAAPRMASVLDRPGLVTRIPDVWLRSAEEVVFRAGAYEACESMCLAAFRAYGSPMHLFDAARCAARLGDADRAFEHLRSAIAAGFVERARMAVHPDLASLHADPRFASL